MNMPKPMIPAFALAAASAVGAVTGFDGARRLVGDETYDNDLVTKWTDYVNKWTGLPGPLDRNGDSVADSGVGLPWRTDVSPAGSVYASTAEGTHAGSAPVWGGWEWIAYNTGTPEFSNQRFCINDASDNSAHEYADFFNYRVDFAKDAAGKTLHAGEVSGATVFATPETLSASPGSSFRLKIHNRDNLGTFKGRFLIETAPGGTADPDSFEVYISDLSFICASGAEQTLVLEKDTVFRRYFPGRRLRFDPAGLGPAFQPPFRNIVGAGYYFESDVTAGSANTMQRLAVRSFEFVDVPPPSSATLLVVE